MKGTLIDKIRYFFLYLLIVLIALYSHPTIMEMSRSAGLEQGTILSRYIMIVFILLFLFSLDIPRIWKSRWLRRLLWMLFAIIVTALLLLVAKSTRMIGDVRAIGICVAAVLVGWQLNLSEKHLDFVLLLFCLMLMYVGLMQVVTNIGGFVIDDQLLADNKNAFGVMLASSCFIFAQLAFDTRKTFPKLLLFLGAAFAMVVMLTIRARAAVLAAVLVIGYSYFLQNKKPELIGYSIFALLGLALVVILLPDSVKDFVYNSFFQNSHGDITSGRLARNEAGIDFFLAHPIFGLLTEDADFAQIHNYPLNRLCEYGIFFCIPILVMYVSLLVQSVKLTVRLRPDERRNLGFFLILIPFVISMAEPSLPFGPGTSTVFNFIVFGYSMRCYMERDKLAA